jgi:hypothetical protein
MSPQQEQALRIARDALCRGRGLDGLSADDRAAVSSAAETIALRVADAIEATLAGWTQRSTLSGGVSGGSAGSTTSRGATGATGAGATGAATGAGAGAGSGAGATSGGATG